MPLADNFAVSGTHGVLILLAFLVFFAAAIIAWFVEPRAKWGTAIAAGLALFMLALLFGG
jgi:uncharacterized membrane protein YqjE